MPHVGADRTRRAFLQPLRLSSQAIVLRHYPIGKGFLVAIDHAADRYHDAEEDAGRPPFLFVKCWQMRYERHSGVVRIKYDVR